MMLSLSHLERQLASRVHRSRRLYVPSSAVGVAFEQTLPSSHFGKIRRLKLSVPLDSSISKDDSKYTERVDWAPMTMKERVVQFPKGVFRLMKDCLLYKLIHDASRSPLNAWTIDRSSYKNNLSRNSYYIYSDGVQPGRIPRRQYEQQRRALVDIEALAPIILLWIPPIIGFLPLILGVTAPRQVLSRQFHNEYEIYHYTEIEYQQRKKEFSGLAEMFWNTTVLGHRASELNIPSDKEDAAGPIIDALPLYSAFANDTGASSKRQLQQSVLQSVDSIPREYLDKLALAIGVNQNLPGWLSPVVTKWSPKRWLQYRVRQTAQVVSEDDNRLLLEHYDEGGCLSLADIEALDAWYVMIRCFLSHSGRVVATSRNYKRLTPSSHTRAFLLSLLRLRLVPS
jgi:hypothetical protein